MCNWAAATQRNAGADTQLVWHVAVKSLSLSHYTHSHTHTLTHLSLSNLTHVQTGALFSDFDSFLTPGSVMCRQCQQKGALQITANGEFAKQRRNWRRPTVRCSLDVCYDNRWGSQAVLSGPRRANGHNFRLHNARYEILAAVSTVTRRRVFG